MCWRNPDLENLIRELVESLQGGLIQRKSRSMDQEKKLKMRMEDRGKKNNRWIKYNSTVAVAQWISPMVSNPMVMGSNPVPGFENLKFEYSNKNII